MNSVPSLLQQYLLMMEKNESAYPFVNLQQSQNLHRKNMEDSQVHHCILSDTCLGIKRGENANFYCFQSLKCEGNISFHIH